MKKKLLLLLSIVFTIMTVCVPVSATTAYSNYVYDYYTKSPVSEPQAYEPEQVITAQTIGVDKLFSPQDVFRATDGRIYLADSGNNRVLILDSEWRLSRIIDKFQDENGQTSLNDPRGVYVNGAGELYVADTGTQRIVVFTDDGDYLRQYGRPDSPLIDSNFLYAPIKVVATDAGKMFIVSENEIKGAMQIDRNGKFIGFYGAVQTVPNLAESFWRMIATEEQLDRLSQTVPTNYSNLDMDDDGFVYATVSAVEQDSSYNTDLFVRRLNPMGNDVLRRDSWLPITGDYQTVTGSLSKLCDICVVGNGIYSVLGQEYCRVYTYDYNGNLLFVFGAKGQEYGQLENPVALASLPEYRYAVVDEKLNQIVIYHPTEYANLLLQATEAFYHREYTVSEEKFTSALQFSSKSDIVYVGVGRAMLRNRKYKEAMNAFRLGNNPTLYSEALVYYRKQLGREIFPWLLVGAVVCIIIAMVCAKIRRRRPVSPVSSAPSTCIGNLCYAKYVIFHPFDGFWCLKRERTRTGWPAMILVGCMVVLCVLSPQLTAYLFNTGDRRFISALSEIAKVLIPFFVWCVGNWCITTLMNGEGSFKQIAVTTAYAMTPLILTKIILIVLSQFLTYNEQALYSIIMWIGWIWFALLLFIGIMTIHQFSVSKTCVTVLLACVAAVIILILVLVLFALVGKLTGFVSVLWRELMLRL